MVSKDFNVKGFNKIEVGGAVEVTITRADEFKVSVTADDFSHVRVEQINDTLIISRQGIEWLAPFHIQPRATVTLPLLTGLTVSGASRVRLEKFESSDRLTVNISGASRAEAHDVSAGKLELKVAGASRLTGEMTAKDDFILEASGASNIELAGMGGSAVMKVNGASKAELSKFPVQNASMVVIGASKAFINLNGKLNANVAGASSLYWTGTPVMGDIQTSGASNLHHK